MAFQSYRGCSGILFLLVAFLGTLCFAHRCPSSDTDDGFVFSECPIQPLVFPLRFYQLQKVSSRKYESVRECARNYTHCRSESPRYDNVNTRLVVTYFNKNDDGSVWLCTSGDKVAPICDQDESNDIPWIYLGIGSLSGAFLVLFILVVAFVIRCCRRRGRGKRQQGKDSSLYDTPARSPNLKVEDEYKDVTKSPSRSRTPLPPIPGEVEPLINLSTSFLSQLTGDTSFGPIDHGPPGYLRTPSVYNEIEDDHSIILTASSSVMRRQEPGRKIKSASFVFPENNRTSSKRYEKPESLKRDFNDQKTSAGDTTVTSGETVEVEKIVANFKAKSDPKLLRGRVTSDTNTYLVPVTPAYAGDVREEQFFSASDGDYLDSFEADTGSDSAFDRKALSVNGLDSTTVQYVDLHNRIIESKEKF